MWRSRGGEQRRVASVTDGVGTSGDVIVRGRRAQVASRAAGSGRFEGGGHRWRRGRRAQVASRAAVTGGVEGGEAAAADG